MPLEAHEALLLGVEHICLELTARFLADSLNESYFGWDRERFSRRGSRLREGVMVADRVGVRPATGGH